MIEIIVSACSTLYDRICHLFKCICKSKCVCETSDGAPTGAVLSPSDVVSGHRNHTEHHTGHHVTQSPKTPNNSLSFSDSKK